MIVRSLGEDVDDFAPYNSQAIRAGFAFANGGLGWSIIMAGNKIVLHDPAINCMLFIHFSPAVLAWCLRWHAAGTGWHDAAGMWLSIVLAWRASPTSTVQAHAWLDPSPSRHFNWFADVAPMLAQPGASMAQLAAHRCPHDF